MWAPGIWCHPSDRSPVFIGNSVMTTGKQNSSRKLGYQSTVQTGTSKLIRKGLITRFLKRPLVVSLAIMTYFVITEIFHGRTASSITVPVNYTQKFYTRLSLPHQIPHVRYFLFNYQLVCSPICKNEHIPYAVPLWFCTSISAAGCSCSRRKQWLSLLW